MTRRCQREGGQATVEVALLLPLLVPLAWLMMLPPAWAVSQRITGRVSGVAFVAVSALAFTSGTISGTS